MIIYGFRLTQVGLNPLIFEIMHNKVLSDVAVDNISTMNTQILGNWTLGVIVTLILIGIIIYVYRRQMQYYINQQWIKIKNLIKKGKIMTVCKQIESLIHSDKWADALRKFDELKSSYSSEETNEINDFLTKNIKDKFKKAITSKDIKTLSNILSILLSETLAYKNAEFVQNASQEAEKLVEGIILDYLGKFNFKDAENIFSLYKEKCWFDSRLKDEIQEKIVACKEAKKAKIDEELREFENAIQKGDIEKAKEKLALAESLNDGQVIEEAHEKLQKKADEQAFKDFVLQIRQALDLYDLPLATQLLNESKSNPEKDDVQIAELENLKNEVQSAVNAEQRFNEPQCLVRIKGFNVPKKENYGEDADPYDCVDSNKSWGVISVFDGMGGAGARKYIHDETQEEHTSAYWASRFVHSAVKELIEERNTKHIGENPISFIELFLHQRIKDKLDREVTHFLSASSTMSKMIRKLPTTIAMCAYEINSDMVHVKTYWAGDSRIYMFDLERMSFLTIDDADAPDNDPFSPANMDLAMSNAISQERSFRINKYQIDIPLDKNKPFVLLACTDGCFGYFKNPIEFEYMVRAELKDSKDWNEWSDRMKDAIIRNGKSDDLSLVGVVFGVELTSFDDFKQRMQERLSNSIFGDYGRWKKNTQSQQDTLMQNVNTLTEEVSEMSAQYDFLKEFNDKIQEIDKFLDGIVPNSLNSLRKELLEKMKNLNTDTANTLSNIRRQIDVKRETLAKDKNTLDNLQLRLQGENNVWYEKYKEIISYNVEPLTTI